MAELVTMPKLGFDMAEGTLVRWVVPEGEAVKKGSVLAEIETDKATVEVESNFDGIVVRHLVEEGTPVPIGDPIAVIGAQGEKVDVNQLLPSQPGQKGAEETTPGGEGGPGSAVAPESETGLRPDAPTTDQEALPRPSGVEAAQETAPPSKDGGEKAAEGKAPPAQTEGGVAEAAPAEGELPDGVRASPLARRMAEELGVDLRQVKGSGPSGRITKTDIESYRERPPVPAAPAPAPAASPAQAAPSPEPASAPAAAPFPAPVVYGGPREDQRIPLSRLRAAVGRRMVQSKQQAPHFYVTHEYDVAALMELRKQVNAMLPEEEKTSVNDFIVKAVALTLRQFPNVNAALDEKANQVIQFGHINISNAVAVEGGLLTVVVKDADLKPIRQISSEMKAMAARARQGKIRPEDVEGSTFSVSNLGMYDVEHFIAVLNPPEAGILAIGSAREVPVIVNGEVKAGLRMKATISIDHRVSDGAEGARFMQALAEYIEKPMLMLV